MRFIDDNTGSGFLRPSSTLGIPIISHLVIFWTVIPIHSNTLFSINSHWKNHKIGINGIANRAANNPRKGHTTSPGINRKCLTFIGNSKSDSIRDCLSGSILTILASASNSFLNLLSGRPASSTKRTFSL